MANLTNNFIHWSYLLKANFFSILIYTMELIQIIPDIGEFFKIYLTNWLDHSESMID